VTEQTIQSDARKDRIVWLDQLRAVCILLILWLHTDIYYTGHETIPYVLYVTNALTIFFFISGYLFFTDRPFSLRRKLVSIIRSLLVPYFFFTLLLALPKALVRHRALLDILSNIFIGNGSWFVAALIVAEIIFACILYLRQHWLLHLLPVVALILSWLFSNTLHYDGPEVWNFRSAFIALIFLYLGYQYHRHEDRLLPLCRPLPIVLLSVLALLSKAYVLSKGIQMVVGPVIISNYPVFLFDTITIILLAIAVVRYLPSWSWLQWIGRHTLVYYFFCGAVPTVVSMLLPPYQGYYLTILLPYSIVCLLTTAITYLCYRFLPFILHHR